MVKKPPIVVTRETKSGLNTHFKVPGQTGAVTRGQLADQIERGLHPDYHVRKLGGRRIPVSNPNSSICDNLD